MKVGPMRIWAFVGDFDRQENDWFWATPSCAMRHRKLRELGARFRWGSWASRRRPVARFPLLMPVRSTPRTAPEREKRASWERPRQRASYLGPQAIRQQPGVYQRVWSGTRASHSRAWSPLEAIRVHQTISFGAAERIGNLYPDVLGRLLKARSQADSTQVQGAWKLGRRQSCVSKCKSGERRVDVVELREFARLCHKSLDFFVD